MATTKQKKVELLKKMVKKSSMHGPSCSCSKCESGEMDGKGGCGKKHK